MPIRSCEVSSPPVSLCWQPVGQRVTFKLACLQSIVADTKPPLPICHLSCTRSSSAHLHAETTLASRGFRSAWPRIWNSLPNDRTRSLFLLFLLVQIKAKSSPLYFNSSITDQRTLRVSDSTSYSILRALQMFNNTLHHNNLSGDLPQC